MDHKVVRCVRNDDHEKELTVGKYYKVFAYENDFYKIENDNGIYIDYLKTRFEEIEPNEEQVALKILDSGERTSTGAVRDMREGKGRCDLMPLEVICKLINDNGVIDSLNTCKQAGCNADKIDALYQSLEIFCDERYENTETMILDVAKHFEGGAKKYGENNWQKGLPQWCYLDSAIRHYLKYERGDNDEPHDRAFVWNVMCLIWTIQNIKEGSK